MRAAFSVWVALLTFGGGGIGQASADPFALADPRVAPSWGRQPGKPTAPSRTVEADADLPADLSGQPRTVRYVDELLASAINLDTAAAYHSYSPVTAIHGPPSRPQLLPETGPRAAVDAAAIAGKSEEAGPELAAELDGRFDALTAAAKRADAIVVPTGPGAAPVTYCRWIGEAAGLPSGPLGDRLWKRCIERQDTFIAVLVGRMADLAAIPDVGTAGAVDARELLARLQLPEAVLPGEVRAPLAHDPLEGAFQQRLGTRFDAAAPRLQAGLSDALARRAATDVLLPPAADCRSMLGPYAGPLAELPAARKVAGELGGRCMAAVQRWLPYALDRVAGSVMAELDARAAQARDGDVDGLRIAGTPEATCAGLLAPHFPAGSEPYRTAAFPLAAQFEELRLGCLARARQVHDAIIERHLGAAVAASRPEDDSVAAWEARGWFAAPPGGTAWLDGRADPGALAAFANGYEAVMQPRRKEVASRLAAGLERSFATDTGIEPQAAARACAASYQPTIGDTLSAIGSAAPGARTPVADTFRARPGLTVQEAAGWIIMTCRDLHARTLAVRRNLAIEAGHAGDVFKGGLKMAVPSPSGDWVPVDPAKLVASAATDMIQVDFVPSSTFSAARMTVTPFGRSSPSLSGKLVEANRPGDGKAFLRLDGLQGFPELNGPLETVACVAMQVDQARRQGRLKMFAAATAAFFGDSFIVAGAVEDAARRDLLDVDACAAAKRTFTGTEGTQ